MNKLNCKYCDTELICKHYPKQNSGSYDEKYYSCPNTHHNYFLQFINDRLDYECLVIRDIDGSNYETSISINYLSKRSNIKIPCQPTIFLNQVIIFDSMKPDFLIKKYNLLQTFS